MSMVEVKGDLYQMVVKAFSNKHINAVCVMTNSVIKANGKATLPPEVCQEIPFVWFDITDDDGSNKRTCRMEIRQRLANLMKADSRHKVRRIGLVHGKEIIGFPHKMHWRDDEDFAIILRSAEQLVNGINKLGWKFVSMPRPVQDDAKWEALKPQLESVFNKTACRIGIYDGVTFSPPKEQPKPEVKPKAFKDMNDEEKKEFRKAAALKAKATKERKKREAAEAALLKQQEQDIKRIEAELEEQLKELD